ALYEQKTWNLSPRRIQYQNSSLLEPRSTSGLLKAVAIIRKLRGPWQRSLAGTGMPMPLPWKQVRLTSSDWMPGMLLELMLRYCTRSSLEGTSVGIGPAPVG